MKQKIAFFDFDGTITTKDTLLEFIKHSKGPARFYLGFILNSPWLIAWKLKLISNQTAKEKVLRFFFRHTPIDEFEQLCASFSRDILPGLIRPKALGEIRKLQAAGVAVVIVSASPENWIHLWTETLHTDLLATRLGIASGKDPARPPRLTGKIIEKNCHGEEKVRRIRNAYTLEDYQEIYTYGDSSGDRPMLKLGTASFYKPFR